VGELKALLGLLNILVVDIAAYHIMLANGPRHTPNSYWFITLIMTLKRAALVEMIADVSLSHLNLLMLVDGKRSDSLYVGKNHILDNIHPLPSFPDLWRLWQG
jgi:hypothetical protein